MKASIIKKGDTFEYWTVLDPYAERRKTSWYARCICRCGKVKLVKKTHLADGRSKSCHCRQAHRLPPGESARRHLILQYKNAAKYRGVPWELSSEEFYTLVIQPCFYCGSTERSNVRRAKKEGYSYTGIDRIENDKGYTSSNCVPCCQFCNYAKRQLSKEEFLAWATKIYLYQLSKRT